MSMYVKAHIQAYMHLSYLYVYETVSTDTPWDSHLESTLGRHPCVYFKHVGTYSKHACKLNQTHPTDNQSTLTQSMIFRGTKKNYNNLIRDTEFVSKLPSILSFTSSVFVNLTVSIII